MPFTALLHSLASALEMLVLSWTSHARLMKAEHPIDFDLILKRTIREVKFHSETLLAVLFFMGTSGVSQPLISWALACLLYTLITYTALEAMSGEALHKWIDEIPCGRLFLACFTKLPAVSVLTTLCALALTRWYGIYTSIVMVTTFGMLIIAICVRVRLYDHVVRACRYAFSCCIRRKPAIDSEQDNSQNSQNSVIVQVPCSSDSDSDVDSVSDAGKTNPAAHDMV